MTKTFRFGVGTALICFSLMLLPWTSVWLSGLPFDSKEPVLHNLIEVLVRDVVPMALLLAFVTGICSALRSSSLKNGVYCCNLPLRCSFALVPSS